MNKRCSVFGILILAVGCHASADAGFECADELKVVQTEASVRIDVEKIVDDLVGKLGAEDYWSSIEPIDTSCPRPKELPDLMPIPVGSGDAEAVIAKPVRRIKVSGRAGVVFVYRSVGVEETTTGFAAAVVEYRENGEPARIYKASELLSDEGWGRLTTSTLSATSTTRCDQELEFFTYSDNGDIVGELETPTRTPRFCENIISFPSGS
jgi:hypothetical protein